VKYINIFYLNVLALFLLSGCITHPSPHPMVESTKSITNPKSRVVRNVHLNPKSRMPKKIHSKKHSSIEKETPTLENKSIYFLKNSFTFEERSVSVLQNIAKILRKMPLMHVNIIGYVNKKDDSGYNITLAYSRASAVSNYLKSKGVSKKQIQKVFTKDIKKSICKENIVRCQQKSRIVTVEVLNTDSTQMQKYQVIDTKVAMLHKRQSKEAIKRKLMLLQKHKTIPYKIGSGDKFDVSIYGEPELSVKGGVVKPDGTLTVSMVGDVKVSGMRINDAMKKISNKLTRYMQKPIVSLIPAEFRAQSYTILGKINKPGNYPVHEKSRVLDSIADAGGFSIGVFKDNMIELADLEHAFIRRGTEVLPVNFMELVRKGNPLHNIPLEDKDYIYIPSVLNTEVYMLGEVKVPGFFGYKERMTLTQLISHAKGYTDKANINQVAIIRGYLSDPSVYLVDLEKVLEGRAIDFMLEPYDIVFIPKTIIGDWNTMLNLLTPSLEGLTSSYIATQLLRGK